MNKILHIDCDAFYASCEEIRNPKLKNYPKAGTNVNTGDIIEISFGKRNLKVKVLDLIEGAKKNDAGEMFEVIDE